MTTSASAKELQEMRRKTILEIVSDPYNLIWNQEQLVKRLRDRGIEATQSNVSRDLKALSIERIDGHYQVVEWTFKTDPAFKKVTDLVNSVSLAGPSLTVVETSQGAAKMVAVALEKAKWPEVKGILAGETTIFIATANSQDQARVVQRFKTLLLPPKDE